MMGLGTPELIIIFAVALIFFGPRKLPELGRSLGKALGEFKRTSNDLRSTLDDEIRAEERRATAAAVAAAPVLSPPPVAGDASVTSDAIDVGEYPETTDDIASDTVARGSRPIDTKSADIS